MIQIAYTSNATESLASGDVFKIIEKSAQNNAKAELTGFLIYSNARFFQVIEGSVANVDRLITRLKNDPRHHSIRVVHHTRIIERSFPNWRMKRIVMPDDSTPLEAVIPQLSAAPERVKRVAEDFLSFANA